MAIINTRADLNALKGTSDYLNVLKTLSGTMTTRMDVAERPDNYGADDYVGEEIAPIWQDTETLGTIQRLGFATRGEFEAYFAAAMEE